MIQSKQEGRIELRILSVKEHHQISQQGTHQSSSLRIVKYNCKNTIDNNNLKNHSFNYWQR